MLLQLQWLTTLIYLFVLSVFTTNTVSIGLVGQPQSFLPHEARIDAEKTVSEMLFKKLFKFENDQLVNELIDSYSINPDKKVYNFKLKDNIKWQDGTEITTSDAIYSISLYPDLINNMDIEKISDKEFRISLETPISILPNLLTFGIEPSHLQTQSKKNPVGSSSFVLLKNTNERRNLESTTLYSNQENKRFNKIVFKYYNTESQLKTAFNLGEIDAYYSSESFDSERVVQKSMQLLGRYFTLIFNTKASVLNDVSIRNTLRSSLDVNKLLASRNFYVNSLLAEGPISHSAYTTADFKRSFFKPNARLTPAEQKAVKTLVVLLPENTDGRQIEQFLRDSWGKGLGINLDIRYLSEKEILENGQKDEFDVLFIGHEVTADPDRYAFWHSTQAASFGYNLSKFEDLRADKALEEGRLGVGLLERTKHYNIFQDVISTKVPAVFLYHPGLYIYISKTKINKFTIPEKIYYPWDIMQNF